MNDLIKAIDTAPMPQKAYLKNLFEKIPVNSRSCRIVKIEENSEFITANEPCNKIWILIEGQVRAAEEQVSGDVYVFTEFAAPEFFGEMEVLAGVPNYKVTLLTATSCRFIVMSVKNYLNWICNDSEAMLLRVNAILRRTLEDLKDDRAYLFLDGVNRLIIYITKYYKKYAKDKICVMEIKRQQIADETGFSVKTVNRSIKKLLDNGLITMDKRKIVISEKQYGELLKLIDNKIIN